MNFASSNCERVSFGMRRQNIEDGLVGVKAGGAAAGAGAVAGRAGGLCSGVPK